MPDSGRFGIFLDRTNTPHTIDRSGVAPVPMPMGAKEHEGPDLGVVVLAPSIAGSIAAKKLFFNLDSHREQVLHSPRDLDEGVWCANGFLEEWGQVRENDDGQGSTQYFYNFSGFGGPTESAQVGNYDYFEFPVSYEARPQMPKSWGGMSGGGLWQVQLKRDEDSVKPMPPYVLSGVLFYQWSTTPEMCGVRAHGRRSVYDVAYRAIVGSLGNAFG
jgi:hypothetical protein